MATQHDNTDNSNDSDIPEDDFAGLEDAPEASVDGDLFADFAELDEALQDLGLSESASQITLRQGEVNVFPFFSKAKDEYISAGLKFDSAHLLSLRFYRQVKGGQAMLAKKEEDQEWQFIIEGSIALGDDILGLIDPATGELRQVPALMSEKSRMWRERMHLISFQQMGANEETAEVLKAMCDKAKYVEQPLDPQRKGGAREYIWIVNPKGESPSERLENALEVTRLVVSVDARQNEHTGEWIGFRDFLTATVANISRCIKAKAANAKSPNAYLGELTGTQSDSDGRVYAARPGMPEVTVLDTAGNDKDLVLVKRKSGPTAGVIQ